MDNKNFKEDDYLSFKHYEGRPASKSLKGFSSFDHEGEFYFTLLDSAGNAFMRSEGYSAEKGRENGMESVNKNKIIPERWSIVEQMKHFFLVLKAGNHQEIAKSGAYKTKAAAEADLAAFMSGKTIGGSSSSSRVAETVTNIASAATGVAAGASGGGSKDVLKAEDKEDDYLSCKDYEGHPVSDKKNNVAMFKHENGQYYFALYHSDGSVKIRSEGFETAKNRDQELSGVLRFHDNDAMYTKLEKGKYYMMVLKDDKGTEVGRSCLQKTEEASAAVVGGSKDVLKEEDKEDDYLSCKEYEGHPVNDKENNVAMFKHENGQFYFALYHPDGSVKLRSEGFETAKNRDQELSGVLRYHKNDSMYSMFERGKYFMMILKDDKGTEVGRSCLHKTPDSLSSSSTGLAAGAAGLGASKIISETRNVTGETRGEGVEKSRSVTGETRGEAVEKSRSVIGEKRNVLSETKGKIKEDDYLKCEVYKGHKITDTKNRVATFKGPDDQLYFAVYNKDGSVRLRSEGFKTEEGRADELKQCIANMENDKRYSTIKRGKYFINVLKDGTGREVARSCMTKEVQETVAWVAPAAAVAATVVTKEKVVAVKETPPPPPKKVVKPVVKAAPIVEEVAAAKSGWWKWLLLLIPLLLLLFWWKSCRTVTPPVVAPVVKEVVKPVVKTPPPPPPPPAPKCNCADLTHPIFKIPSGPAPKTTTVLGRAPEYGNSHSLDPKGFYNKLNAKYKASAAERRFLDGISKQLGFEGGWKDITPSVISAVNVPRGVSGNLGTKTTHKTVYRKLDPTNAKDLKAFRFTGKNACNLHFMKTCGNHFFYQKCE